MGAVKAQFQVTLVVSTEPLKANVSLQSLSGIAMLTCLVWPGVSVPLCGLKLTPAVLVDADHDRFPVLF